MAISKKQVINLTENEFKELKSIFRMKNFKNNPELEKNTSVAKITRLRHDHRLSRWYE